jgi:hypothetical protein
VGSTLTAHSDRSIDKSKGATHAKYAAGHISHTEFFLSLAESHLFWFSRFGHEIQAKRRAFLLS